MVRGELGVRTSGVTSGTPAFELIAPAGAACYLRRMTISMGVATASTYGLGRPAAIGVTPTSPVRLLSPEGASQQMFETKTALAWGTPPTAPTAFFRRISLTGSIGANIAWDFTFGNGLYIPAGGTLVLWNLALNGVVDVAVEVNE